MQEIKQSSRRSHQPKLSYTNKLVWCLHPFHPSRPQRDLCVSKLLHVKGFKNATVVLTLGVDVKVVFLKLITVDVASFDPVKW